MIISCKAGPDFKTRFQRLLQEKTTNTRRLVGFGRRIEGMPDYRIKPEAPEYVMIVTDNSLSDDDKYFLLAQFIGTIRNNMPWVDTRFVLADYDGAIQINKMRHRLSRMVSMIKNHEIPRMSCASETETGLNDNILRLIKNGVPLIILLSTISEINTLQEMPPTITDKVIALVKDSGEEHEEGIENRLRVFLIQSD